MAVYRLPFDNDGIWKGGSNWDDPQGSPHGWDQAYAYDFGHPVGGMVRAARAGVVTEVTQVQGSTKTEPNGDVTVVPAGATIHPAGTAMWIRHWDNTVAIYAHMVFHSPRFGTGDYVFQGAVIGTSGFTGNASGPHLHFDVRSFRNSETDRGPTIPVQFEDSHHHAWRPRKGDDLVSNNVVLRQDGWRRCHRCAGLFFGGTPAQRRSRRYVPRRRGARRGRAGELRTGHRFQRPRPGELAVVPQMSGTVLRRASGHDLSVGGKHDGSASADYVLVQNLAKSPGETNWRWCSKCEGLFFGGHPDPKCPAGGSHTSAGSGDYSLARMGPGETENWRRCKKCQGLFLPVWGGSRCAAGGTHDPAGTPQFVVARDYIPPNAPGLGNWRRCKKCQAMFYAGRPGSRCPADDEAHEQTEGEYTLVDVAILAVPATAPGQRDWRCCNKCQGLFFAGNPGSRCPADGAAHTQIGSGNYSLLP